MTSFKFFRHLDGKSAFAVVSVRAVRGTSRIVWSADSTLQKHYGVAVCAGIEDARAWHGDPAVGFEVAEVEELLVDTKPDAVRCAATAAAWIELGHAETELQFAFEGAEWRVRDAR
jgi:hypothetical protein